MGEAISREEHNKEVVAEMRRIAQLIQDEVWKGGMDCILFPILQPTIDYLRMHARLHEIDDQETKAIEEQTGWTGG